MTYIVYYVLRTYIYKQYDLKCTYFPRAKKKQQHSTGYIKTITLNDVSVEMM